MDNDITFLLTKQGRRAVEVFTRQVMPRCGIMTRGSVQQATVGCRWWQLVYAILVSLPYPMSTLLVWSKGMNVSSEWKRYQEGAKRYQEMVDVTRAVIQQIEAYRGSSLYSILYRNQAVECAHGSGEPCLRRINASFVDSAADGRYYVCLYKADIIGHYFIIERRRPFWYISSSYGSEWVRVPVQTQEVPENELREWLDAIEHMGKENRDEEDTRILERFFIHYFLEGGLPVRYSENEPKERRGRPIPSHIGIAKEVEIALHGPLHIGYIESMEEYIQDMVANTVKNVIKGGYFSTRRRSRKSGVGTKRKWRHRLARTRRGR